MEDKEVKDKTVKQEKQKAIFKELLEWLIYLAVVLVVCFFITRFVGQRTEVFGSSMEPTLHNGDNLITDKISYRFRDPKRFDVIVFPYDEEDEINYIKRVIGLPGETVQVKDGYVYIDGQKLDEDYGNEVMDSSGIAADPIELGEDQYFVLGDNRNHSADSRQPNVGPIEGQKIIGRAWVRIYPFNKIGVVRHE